MCEEDGASSAVEASAEENLGVTATRAFAEPMAVARLSTFAEEGPAPSDAGGPGASHESIDSIIEAVTGAPMTMPLSGGTVDVEA